MKSSHLLPSLIVAACLTVFAVEAACADDSASTIKFSNPGKPGTVKINLGRGELTVQGTDSPEVSVRSDAKPNTSKPRKDGLRVISAASSFAFSEKDNVVTVDAATNDFGRGSGNFRLMVPRNTSVIVQNAWGGNIACSNLSGDIEINSMHGEIKLDDVSGGIVVGTMNGEIRANLRELREGKTVSFTTMNGEVHIRVPESAKANVRFRTQNGQVLTDFDETALVTKTETSPGFSKGKFMMASGRGKVIGTEVEEAIREATRVSATAAREALEAVKAGLEASRIESDEARQKVEEAKKEIESARREADRQRRAASAADRAGRTAPGTPATPALPETAAGPGAMPKPPAMPKLATIPTITGGKLVTGTLNGGGPEISVSTMNGDVVLRRLEEK